MSIYENFQPISFDEINTYELASRPSKVTVKDFAEAVEKDDSLKQFLEKLPDILAVKSLRELAAQIRCAKSLKKPIVLGIGGHIVKTGLAPVIIDLMKRGFVSAIASNGSVLVHDTEIALVGFTSEDVDASLGKGDFGAAKETGEILNSAAKNGMKDKIGLGEAMGREVSNLDPPNAGCFLALPNLQTENSVHRTFNNRRRHRTFSRQLRRSSSRRGIAHGFQTFLFDHQAIKRRRRLFEFGFSRRFAGNFLKSRHGCAKFRVSA